MLGCIRTIQRWTRRYLAEKLALQIRMERAAIILQKNVRGWIKRIQVFMSQNFLKSEANGKGEDALFLKIGPNSFYSNFAILPGLTIRT